MTVVVGVCWGAGATEVAHHVSMQAPETTVASNAILEIFFPDIIMIKI